MKQKNILKLVTLLLFTSAFCAKAQTTLEEYNYVTKGYKVQIESGLDMKKGYELSHIDADTTAERVAELKVLYRFKNAKKEIAAYMIVYNRIGYAKEYICVPNPKSEDEIKTKYWTELYDGKGESSFKLQLICYLLTNQLKW